MTGLDGNGCAWLGIRSASIQRRVLGDTHHAVSICEISGFYTWRTLVRRSDRTLCQPDRKLGT